MKTIIVPTDFSANAQNATEYAAQLAKVTKAKLILLHVFSLPAVIDGALVSLSYLQRLNKKLKARLSRIAKKLSISLEINVESHTLPGYVTEVLPDFVKKQSGDLVIMGMRGMNNAQKIFLGSVTTTTLKKADFPLIIVPIAVRYHPIKNILLACDYHSDTINKKLSLVKESALAFNADIKVLHIGPPELEMAELSERVETGRQLERLLKGARHSYIFLEEEDIVTGIRSSIKTNRTDLLVMIPRKRNFWQSLTHRSNTQRIALDIDIPLLALPHSNNE